MSRTVLEWIYFQWYQRGDKENWSKVIVREPWERLVRGHPEFQQDEGGEEALFGYCMIWIMDIHIHHDGELIRTALVGWRLSEELHFFQDKNLIHSMKEMKNSSPHPDIS